MLAVLFTYFCIPEVQGRTLEEIEDLFAMNIPFRQFRHTTTASGARALEDVKVASNDKEVINVSQTGTASNKS
jgi:hypothetical protein